MGKFDLDEQHIHEKFSKITVDSSKLAEQVKSRLYEDSADMPARHRQRWTRSTIVAIAMSFVLVASATAAVFGNLDWFIERFNPDFGKIVEPVEVYSEDQGIRMKVIGAKKYGNMAIVYLSIQDITGQKRLTEKTDFRDGFSVKMNPQTLETTTSVNEFISGGIMWKKKMLYFDEDTNTIYYEFNITADPDTPFAEPLKLGSHLIYFDEKDYNDEPIFVSLTKIKDAETTPIEKVQFWSGSSSGGKMPDDLSYYKEALMPGYFADLPHGEKAQWVSNIGIIDGKLHVQIGEIFNDEFGTSSATLSLKDPNGNLIYYDYSFVFLGDKENDLLNLEKNDYADGVYRNEEFVFSVGTDDLSGYTLCYTGSVYTGVKGSWIVSTNLSESNQNMHSWTDLSVEGYYLEYITLSPLGVQVIGSFQGEEYINYDMLVEAETVDEIIPLDISGGSQKPDKHTFHSSWNTKAPLDITEVKAIIINGTRIPMK